jgi:hypothetical protein
MGVLALRRIHGQSVCLYLVCEREVLIQTRQVGKQKSCGCLQALNARRIARETWKAVMK